MSKILDVFLQSESIRHAEYFESKSLYKEALDIYRDINERNGGGYESDIARLSRIVGDGYRLNQAKEF